MMSAFLVVLFVFIILQRIIEIFIARSNERWMKERGGIEKDGNHYIGFIIVHTAFFISILIETTVHQHWNTTLDIPLFLIFILTQLARIWCIYSLGRFWNTKIIILPQANLVDKGPYKYVKHPNYIIVGIELFVIPLLFGAIITAILFPIFHLILLTIRIPAEERALRIVLEETNK